MTTICTIHAVAVPDRQYRWHWQSKDAKRKSDTFRYFYECLEDARRNGFEVDLQSVVNDLRRASAAQAHAPDDTGLRH